VRLLPSLLLVLACTSPAPAPKGAPVPELRTEEPPDPEGTAHDVTETLSRDDGTTYRMVQASMGLLAEAGIGADGNLSGTMRYARTLDGVEVCSVDFAITGTPYTGDCEGCDFAFDMTVTRTAESNPEQCWSYTLATMETPEGSGMRDPVLAHVPTYTTPEWSWTDAYGVEQTYGGYVYADVLRAGFTTYIAAYSGPYGEWPEREYGPYFQNLLWDGSRYGDFAREGDSLAWTWGQAYETSTSEGVQQWCPDVEVSTVQTRRALGIDAVQGEFPCDFAHHDAWSFPVEAGDIVSVTVDTVAAETAFDPMVWVNGPDSCTLLWVDEGFDCSFPPPAFQCPAGKFQATASGTYEVFVGTMSSCAGETAAYALDVQVL